MKVLDWNKMSGVLYKLYLSLLASVLLLITCKDLECRSFSHDVAFALYCYIVTMLWWKMVIEAINVRSHFSAHQSVGVEHFDATNSRKASRVRWMSNKNGDLDSGTKSCLLIFTGYRYILARQFSQNTSQALISGYGMAQICIGNKQKTNNKSVHYSINIII